MTESSGWFAALAADPDADDDALVAAIRDGSADEPDSWPDSAVDEGVVEDEDAYYDRLHRATMTATRAAVTERERADDSQLIHAIRAMDDCQRTANELAERVAEWGGTLDPDAGSGIEYARDLAATEPEPGETAVVSLAEQVVDLEAEAERLRAYVEQTMPTVAPNLAALAGPVLGARLVSLAGGLESLAKKPSGTVQVLGAEDALFAHLRGHAPSPKHGIIYMHDGVRGTAPENRGSAARALAGKLSIAARVDHYSGEYRPDLEAELTERLETIRARTGDEYDGGNGDSDAVEGTNGGEMDE
ncbi:NOP5/NOP56 family protein [Halostagnicola kamekurae]|uniref:rRNA biogenesis protein Nop56/Nop58 n=1 Tax=Halostagnicola kamekurae TaxID=619731 RepID=A0A1I6STD0_9EURY|nr:NOP5/NOP56 family protein [Halostagnicola kamekurae]SFS80151.1 rRNA biogenesis protein Nop56/Nop58 [Halostagnicola kamekurae]